MLSIIIGKNENVDMGKSIKQNAIYNILLNVSSVIFPIITAPYVARVLEPEGIGIVNFAGTYAGYFALVALLGIPTYGVREAAKLRDDKEAMSLLVSQLISIATITTFIISIVYVATIACIGKLTENYTVFLLSGFAIYFSPIKTNWFFQGIEDFGFITRVNILIRVLSIVCLFLFVKEKSDLIIYVILSTAAGVLSDTWIFFKMLRIGIKPKLTIKGLNKHLKPLLVLFSSSIAISIYTVLDTLMLGFITDYEEVGYYSNAMYMSKVILSAVTSLSIVAVPRISYYINKKDFDGINSLINKSFSVVSFLAFPVAIGLACISPVFVPLFFGPKFTGTVIPLIILSMLIIAIGLNNLTGVQTLIGMGYDRLFLYSVLVGTVSNFILNSILIPLFGAVGASCASVVAEVLILFVTTYFVYTRTSIRILHWKDIVKAFVGSLFFIPLLFSLRLVITGWWLVVVFTLSGALLYFVVEYIMNNSAVNLMKTVLLFKRGNSNKQ